MKRNICAGVLLLCGGAPCWGGGDADSVYTELSMEPSVCALVRDDEEGAYSVNRCPGVGGYAVLVEYSDDRMDASVETPRGRTFPLNLREAFGNGFSSLGAKAEWRVTRAAGPMHPHAVIMRFNVEGEGGRTVSHLAVARLTPDEVCVTDRVGPEPDANEAARAAGDLSSTRPCLAGGPPAAPPALEWLRRAEAGDAAAQRELALLYQNGNGLPRDLERAHHWYRKAADQGYDVAQNDLGYLYGNGIGVARDLERARYWYRKAAASGNAVAANNLELLQRQAGQEATRIACPEVVRTGQRLEESLPGWRARRDPAPNPLLHLSFFDGPPTRGEPLPATGRTREPGTDEATEEWIFPPAKAGRIWLSCAYSRTALRLERQLPPGISRCQVTYSTRLTLDDFPNVLGMACR